MVAKPAVRRAGRRPAYGTLGCQTFSRGGSAMAYVTGNPRTKKAAKEMLAAAGKLAGYQLTPWGSENLKDGTVCLEGPHYPAPHSWYATAKVVGGFIVSIK